MSRYTDRQIPFDNLLIQKVNLMAKRCTQKKPALDSLLIIEGGEGSGKTTFSVGVGYYISTITGRAFSDKNVFADSSLAMKFAQYTESQVIIFDEPALDALSAEWWKSTQRDLIKILMLSRKKRHFFIFNVTKFYKFAEYIIVDRSIGMVHLYQRKTGAPAFSYIPKDSLERLYNDYRRMKVRNYRKYTIFIGSFSDVLDKDNEYNLLDIFDVESYEKNKDLAIQSIGKKVSKTISKDRLNSDKIKYKLTQLKFPISSKSEFQRLMKINSVIWKNWLDKTDENIEKSSEKEDTNEATVEL